MVPGERGDSTIVVKKLKSQPKVGTWGNKQ